MATILATATAASASAVATRDEPGPQRDPPAAIDPALRADAFDVPVVVQARPGGAGAVAAMAAQAGARVGAPLPLIDGFSARVSGRAVIALAASPDVVAVTLDRAGAFQSSDVDPSMTDTTTTTSGSSFIGATGASEAWEQGLRGAGVTVAVLDTGISPMPDVADRTIHGPDLSGEGSLIDNYGHGTVMGGIIAGSGQDSPEQRTGVAPEAQLVAVKVAGRNGAVDVSTVLQGMAWVAAHRQELGIRVLNLSYGTTSTQDPGVDPLNFAVQRLWAQGIVVVVAAGNGGPGPRTITKPGDDPVVLTVGAYDDQGDGWRENDSVTAWSSQGPTAQGVAKPDVVAPGRTLVATRSFGSTVEAENPESLVEPSYMKGSGTSEATAVTSGLVALLLQAHPNWTPDQVKRALTSTADPFRDASRSATGNGRVALAAALEADPGPAQQQSPTGSGLGSLEQSRGGAHVTTPCGDIEGEIDVFCQAWDAAAWTGNAWTGNAWTGNAWTGNAWTGNAWTGNAWTAASAPVAGPDGGRTQTAFWGERPKRSQNVAGERSQEGG